MSLAGHNLVDGFALMNYTITEVGNSEWQGVTEEEVKKVEDGRAYLRAPFDALGVGEYEIEDSNNEFEIEDDFEIFLPKVGLTLGYAF